MEALMDHYCSFAPQMLIFAQRNVQFEKNCQSTALKKRSEAPTATLS
jgi:hypothetical protein